MEQQGPYSEINFTGDELRWMRGQQAEEFLRSLEEGGKYFLTLLTTIKEETEEELLGLKPTETEKFSILKAKLDCLYEPMMRVWQDVEVGRIAKQRIDGNIPQNQEGIDLL